MKKRSGIRFSVRIPDILDDRVRKLAKKNRTTITRTVIRALLMYCTKEELGRPWTRFELAYTSEKMRFTN